MRKARLAERGNPVQAQADERQAEAIARSVPAKNRPPGAGMPPEILSLFRERMGIDLSQVQMSAEDHSAQTLDANAYTVGRNIAFAPGQYAPHLEEGQRLIAHELTHVAQQSARGEESIQRQPVAAPPAPTLSPELRFDAALEQLDVANSDFTSSLSTVDDRTIEDAGLLVMARWDNFDTAAKAVEPNATRIDDPQVSMEYHLSPEQQTRFDSAKRRTLTAITLQGFGGSLVQGAVERNPAASGDVMVQLATQLHQVAWVAKDTKDLIALLRVEGLSIDQQWTAIGLLRQHMNPVQFAWMLAALQNAGVGHTFDSFALATRDAYGQLTGAQPGLIEAGAADDPTAEPMPYRVFPADRRVELMMPMKLPELSEALYGSPSSWRVGLLPYNRALLENIGESEWIHTGTSLVFEPIMANEGIRFLVGASDMAQEQLHRQTGDPYLSSGANNGAVAVGNTVKYTVTWPGQHSEIATVRWWYENDPVAVREGRIEARVTGPMSSIGQGTLRSEASPAADVPGNHTIHADVTMPDGTVRHLSLVQVVLTAIERMEVGLLTPSDRLYTPEALIARLIEERDAATGTRRSELDTQIRLAQENLRGMSAPGSSHGMHHIDAIYVSTTGQAMMSRLKVFAGRDPNWPDSLDSHYQLIDFTLGGASTYFGVGHHDRDSSRTLAGEQLEGVESLLRNFASEAHYPDGQIRFPDISQVNMFMSGGARTYPTRGGPMTATILRGLSMVALGVGVVASVALQPEVAVPAFWVSGALAGAGGVADIYERLEHGDFQWDLQTGMDLLDIGAAVVSMGASSAASATVRGVGRFTLRGSIQTGIGMAQIGIMGGTHLAQITAAIQSGDRDAILRAVAHAIADGALILIVHRASARLSEPRAATEPPPTRETTPSERPTTPQGVHDSWVGEMLRTGAGERPAVTPDSPPVGPPAPITAPERAYSAYEHMLSETGHSVEVGVERNASTGEYRVRSGTAHEMSPPEPGWESVLHFHPNESNVLTRRMPAPADIEAAQTAARAAQRPITEFVEYPLPGGGRGRTAYTVEPSSSRVVIEFRGPDGAPVSRPFDSIHDYSTSYGERSTYLEPGSPEYEWTMRDLRDFYQGTATPGRRTASGSASPPPPPPPVVSPEVRRMTPGYTAVPLEGDRLAQVAKRPGPRNLRPGEILVDADGLATWRDPQGRIRSEHPILDEGIGRDNAPNYNKSMPSIARLRPALSRARPGWLNLPFDWAHGVGQSYGIESPIDLLLAPRSFNQGSENIFVEGFDRAMRNEAPGLRLVRTVISTPLSTTDPQLSLFLAERSYRVEAIRPDGSRILVYELSMRPADNGTLDMGHLHDSLRFGSDPDVAGIVELVGNARELSQSQSQRNTP